MADTNSTFTRGTTAREEPHALRPPRFLTGGFPDRYRSLEFTTIDEDSNDVVMAIQVQENGADKSGYFKITVYLADSSLGAPNASNTTTAVTTGVELYEIETDAVIQAMTNSAGLLGMTFTNSGTDTKYVYAEIGGDTYNQSTDGIDFTA